MSMRSLFRNLASPRSSIVVLCRGKYEINPVQSEISQQIQGFFSFLVSLGVYANRE